MELETLQDVLEFAISKEKASIGFYQNLIAVLEDPLTKSLFEVMLRKEYEHVDTLVFEMNKEGLAANPDAVGFASKFQWSEDLDLDESVQELNFVDALLMAIQKERAAFRLYAKISSAVKNPELADILLELAEEEMRHVLQLEKEYQAITHHKE